MANRTTWASALEKGYSKASVAAVQAGLQSAAQKAQAELAAMGKWGTRPAATMHPFQGPDPALD